MFNLDLLFDGLGLAGVILVLLAYFLLQVEKIKSDSILYPLLNLNGAILLLISLLWSWNLASVVIEVCWIAISIFGLVHNLKKRKG